MSNAKSFIPSNGIGVIVQEKPADFYENPYDAVSNLFENYKLKSTRFMVEILEFIASENLKGIYPSSKEIKNHFSHYSNEYLKKKLIEIKKLNLVKVVGKAGKLHQLILYNILPETANTNQLEKKSLTPNELRLQLEILRDFINMESPLIHHIKILTRLKYKDDYHTLCWNINSLKNRAKVFERRISQFRKYIISVQTTGTVIIDISCTNDPYDLCTVDGITNFYGVCGEILNEIRVGTNRFITEPLITRISDWTLSQYDESFDVPLLKLQGALTEKNSKEKGSFGWKFDGCMKVKYLSHLVQIYAKNTTKGDILRLEQRRSFPTKRAPTIRELKKEHLNIIIQNVLNELNIRNIEGPI